MALLSALATEITIPVCAVIGIAFSLVPWWLKPRNSENRDGKKLDGDHTQVKAIENKHGDITKLVFKGVKRFRSTGYWYVGVFVVAFAGLIFLILGSLERFSTQSRPCKSDPSNKCKPALTNAIFTAVSFLLGAFISVLSGFLGMEIAIRANGRTALEKRSLDGRISIAALWSDALMGFFSGIGLLGLYLEIILFKLYYGNDWEGLFEAITGYGLGGSSMALFLRASGGIYAKAADVCLPLVRVIEPEIPETDENPAVITNYVGDIVGDIAGVGPDLFGSNAESSCAALVVASVSSFGIKHDFTAMCYPLLISSMGILVNIFICSIPILMEKIPVLKEKIPILMKKILILMEKIPILGKKIKLAPKKVQLITSTILMTPGIVFVSLIALPPLFTVYKIESPEVVTHKVVKNWELSLCVVVGLWAGLIIEFVNVHDTSDCKHAFSFLQEVDASNVSIGLGSVSIPLFAAFSISVSSHFAATYGIAVAALGMLSTISTRLAIDAYSRISDNAKRIAQMTDLEDRDVANNPTADITEGFAIESAALVSVALFGAFMSRPAVSSPADVLTPKVIIGLIMGAWLPSYFSAMTMKRVGRAGVEMARQIKVDQSPDLFDKCFETATYASFNGMIGPGALVMFAPLIIGTVFGVETLSGLLAGALGSVVQIAISASNTGGARDQAKVAIRAGALKYAKTFKPKSEKERRLRRLAKEGKTTGHPRKDTSGPPLNILIQLMAVESLVLAPWFASHGDLLSKIF